MKTFLIILMLASLCGRAQNCRYDKDEYDKFLKIRKVEKEIKLHNTGWGEEGRLKIKLCKYDSLAFFRITYINRHSTVVGRQDELTFLLEDESIVKAYPDQIYSADIQLVGSTTVCTLNATYLFENFDDIDKLKSKKVKSIRIVYNNVHADYDIKGKVSEDLYEAAQCF